MAMLKKLKQLILRGLKTSGFFSIVQNSQWRHERLLILAYHGISIEDEDRWNPELFMPADLLRARMQLIKKRGYNVLPLNEAVQRLYAGDLPEKSVAITFDDGNYDFYQQALPIIKEVGFPVTLYLTSYYAQVQLPVFDPMTPYLLWKGRDQKLNLREITGKDQEFDLSIQEDRAKAKTEIFQYTRTQQMSAVEKNDLLSRLAQALKIDYRAILDKRIMQILNPDEVKKIAAQGIDIQLHTHRHRVPVEKQLFYREIEDNRNVIKTLVGQAAKHFCYPSGVYETEFFPWLNDLGVISATTCVPGLATKESHHLLLPRFIDTSKQSMIEFEGWLTGISASIAR